ncbi:MAG TPA: histone deacetylase [Acidobacteriota bacterium]|nr:histone deacetylase [Acidobacteriota bacterium]
MTEILDVFKLLLKKRFGFKFVYSSSYWMLNTGKHIFPVVKYRILYERLLELGARKESFLLPEPVSDEDVLRVHTAKYLRKLKTGTLSTLEIQALEIPYSPELVKFALLSAGGTALASSEALKDGLALHLGGGFHHAFPDHGEGFCVLNDIAVAVSKLLAEGRIRKAMIVDCDLHQGNGTAAAFAGESRVFTFSIHQMDIYPSEKVASSLDVGLWSGDGDAAYLAALREHFPKLYAEFRPDLVIYVAGADPYRGDQLGGLDMTIEGLKQRDAIVIGEARKLKVPVAVVLAGGYALAVEDTVAIHLNTIKTAQKAC